MITLTFVTFLYPAFGLVVIPYIIFVNRNKVASKEMQWFSLIFAIIIATLGYNVGRLDGIGYGDLGWNYYTDILMMSNWDWSTAIEMDNEGLFLRASLLWFISRIENNYMLNYIIGFIDYSIIFYMFFDYISRAKKQFTLGELVKFFILILGVTPFYDVIGNVRAITSFIIISFATYRDLIQGKKNIITYALYILPIFLHVAATVMLFLRIIQFTTKKIGRGIAIFAMFVPLAITVLNDYVGMIGLDFVSNTITKAYFYLNWTGGSFANDIQYDIMNTIVRTYGSFYIGLTILLLLIAKKKSIQLWHRDIFSLPMVSYVYSIGVCALGCLAIVTGAFWRFFAVYVFFSMIFLVPLIELNSACINKFLNFLFLSSFCMLCIRIVYFGSTGISRAGLIKGFVTTTGIDIIYNLLNGIINVFFN